jgi:glycerol-1-phosphate dehydrogenase [NAD(P)+]
VDIRPGALDDLAEVLADQRISHSGKLAVAISGGSGAVLRERLAPALPGASWYEVGGGTLDDAIRLADEMKSGHYDAVVGLGGGKIIDCAKFAAARIGLPLVAVATNLSHDGLCSPVATLDNDAGRGSYGVPNPIAVVIDLDVIREAPVRFVRAGIGDAVSNVSAIADWRLAERERGEAVDGVAVTFARIAATSIVHREDGIEDDGFLIALAEALVLSGLAMAIAGSSRPCSGGDHEILHAIDVLFPGTANHGELAGAASLFTSFLREDHGLAQGIDACLRRHDLPRTPGDLGLTEEQFVEAVVRAPSTRPDRFTILEHLALDEAGVRRAVAGFLDAYDR